MLVYFNIEFHFSFFCKATPRRRSGRLRPWERKADRTSQMLHKTLKGGIQKDSSLTSTGSYKEFAVSNFFFFIIYLPHSQFCTS